MFARRMRAELVRLHREQPAYLVAAITLFVGAACLRALVELVEKLSPQGGLGRLDQWAVGHLRVVDNSPMLEALVATTRLGDVWALVGVVAAGCMLLLVARRRLEAIILAGDFGLAAISVFAMKVMVHRDRPDAALHYVPVSTPAFPSGHAALALVAYLLLAYLAARALRNSRWRVGIVSAGVALGIVIAASRLLLGVHWLSDVLGGCALAGAWVSLGVAALDIGRHLRPAPLLNPEQRRRVRWTAIGLLPLVTGLLALYALA